MSSPESYLPYPESALERHNDLRMRLFEGWLALEGSAHRWKVAYSVADSQKKGQLVVFLKPMA